MAFIETESNNTLGTANSTTLGTSITGQLSSSSDLDCYSFTVGTSGVLNIAFTEPANNTQYYSFAAYDSSGTILGIWTTDNSGTVQVGAGATGTYYLAVTGAANTGNYGFTVTETAGGASGYESEDNDSIAKADVLSQGVPITGQLYSSSDSDYYRLAASGSGVLNISFSEPTGNSQSYTITAYNASGTVLGTWNTQDSADYQINVGTAGDYYISVTGAYNTNSYSLTAGFDTASNHTPAGGVAVSGSPYVGQTLSVSNSLADADGLGTITYRWQDSTDGKNWTDIASGNSMTVGSSSLGHYVRAVASYTDSLGSWEKIASSPLGITVPGDISGTTDTASTLAIGSSISSSIDFGGDKDYIKVNLVAGNAYKFDLKGAHTGAGTLSDPYLTLRNPSGTVIRVDDDGATTFSVDGSGNSTDSQIVFIAQETGTYYLDVSAVSVGTGTYQLSSTSLSSDYYLQPVLKQPNTSWHNGTALGTPITITYSFPTSLPSNYTSAEVPGYSAFSFNQESAARSALQYISSVTNISFLEVANQSGQIRFGNSVQSGSAGVTMPWTSNGRLALADIALASNVSSNTNPAMGTTGGNTLVHEIMHALGLKHPGDYNAAGGGATAPYLPSSQDTGRFTIESYNFESIPDKTPAIFDIAALQYLYGADPGTATGNNTYFTSTTSLSTIWDAGGIDTLDGSLNFASVSLDLNPGTVSYSGLLGVDTNLTPCVGIAFNCWIENAKGSTGNDQLVGNVLDNVLTGRSGNDILDGGAGTDTAAYFSARSEYSITRTATGFTVSGGGEGTDTLVNMEVVTFSDGMLRLNSSVKDDANGDFKSDVFWRNASTGDVTLWQMNGLTRNADNLVASAIPLNWTIQGSGDFNGDGKSDILWRNTSTGDVSVWQMNGSTQQAAGMVASGVPLGWAIQGTGDFNGDGKSDILWRNTSTGDVSVWQMDGSTLQAPGMAASGVPLGWAVQGTGDFNGDGKSDILWRNASTGDVSVWQMNGSTLQAAGMVVSGVAKEWAIQGTGDFNGDGKSDILWRNTSTGDVSVSLMNGSTPQAGGIVSSTVSLGWAIQGTGDFNGDGKSDILWRNASNGDIAVWQMNGLSMSSGGTVVTGVSSSWSMQPSLPASPLLSPLELSAHDFNRDGKSDVLWRNTSTGDVSIWQMNGTSMQTAGMAANGVPLGWTTQGTGDFNGDGRSDILWRNTSTGDVSIWQMNGSTQQAAGIVSTGFSLNWAIQGTGDFNGDGRSDILWRNTSTGDVSIWQMNGTAQQAATTAATGVPLGWAIQGTGDFNGDGKSDILWRNTSTGDVSVWQMNGSTQQAAGMVASGVPLGWAVQGTGDFNGDGKSDILWRNTSTGAVSIWQMNGTTQQAAGIVANGAPLNWVIQSIGDFNGDHKSDILWRNNSSGDVAVWQMDGMAQQSAGIVATGTPSEWHIA